MSRKLAPMWTCDAPGCTRHVVVTEAAAECHRAPVVDSRTLPDGWKTKGYMRDFCPEHAGLLDEWEAAYKEYYAAESAVRKELFSGPQAALEAWRKANPQPSVRKWFCQGDS